MYKPPFSKSYEVSIHDVVITDEFWSNVQKINAEKAIFHQWKQLKSTKCLDNFRIVAKEKKGFREGFFYWDSDSHKWSEAAANILVHYPNKKLEKFLEDYISLLKKAQEEDGYLFTYNQFHFPGQRWKNLLIEHELYVFGHLIEAAIAHYQLTNKDNYLSIAEKAADLLVKRFRDLKPSETPGHEEIELALLKLYRVTKRSDYFNLAKNFIKRRGKNKFFFWLLTKNRLSVSFRMKKIEKMKRKHYGKAEPTLFSDLNTVGPKYLKLRFLFSTLSGKYFQQKKPLIKMKKPEGHSVRFGYFTTSGAMLYQETGEAKLLQSLEKLWDNMIQKRMYITGGVGSLALIEGFGRDYELNNKFAYNETCAAISTLFWSWEMLQATNKSCYADLIERELYNAILVGMSIDGKKYFYRNPLEVDNDIERKTWYRTACCPSNISRTLAQLNKYIYSFNDENLWIHQFIGNKATINIGDKLDKEIQLEMESSLPWEGKVKITFKCKPEEKFSLHIRIPSWARRVIVKVNRKEVKVTKPQKKKIVTASGYNPYNSFYITLHQAWQKENIVELSFPLYIDKNKSHPRILTNKGLIALSRGPIVFCLESLDNPNYPIPSASVSSKAKIRKEEWELVDNATILRGEESEKEAWVAIPYFLWGNRGKSAMQVWIKEE
ncbi:MAG: glycoside hydrolase family 127 protein [Candidatus Heimdallarchaeaceae archaeon]